MTLINHIKVTGITIKFDTFDGTDFIASNIRFKNIRINDFLKQKVSTVGFYVSNVSESLFYKEVV